MFEIITCYGGLRGKMKELHDELNCLQIASIFLQCNKHEYFHRNSEKLPFDTGLYKYIQGNVCDTQNELKNFGIIP